MIKKILIAGLFIGVGYYVIKRLLPSTTLNEFEAEEIDDFEVKNNPMIISGGGNQQGRYVKNPLGFDVRTQVPQNENDPSWNFDPYARPNSGDFVKNGINNMVM